MKRRHDLSTDKFDPNNFSFNLNENVYQMIEGKLTINDTEFEEEGSPEMYELSRAYASLL